MSSSRETDQSLEFLRSNMKLQKASFCETTVPSDLDMASDIGNTDANALSSEGTRFTEDSDTPKSSDVQSLGEPFSEMDFFFDNLLSSPMSFPSRDFNATAIDGYPRPEPTSDDQGHQSCKRKQRQDQVFPAAILMQQAVQRNEVILPATLSHEDCSPQMPKKPRLANKHEDPLSKHIILQLLKKGGHVHNHQFQELIMQHRMQHQHNLRSTQQLPIIAAQQQQHNQMQHLCPELVPQFPCHERMMQYRYHIRLRPCEHNIAYWRKFVSHYYVPGARKRWCLSSYEKIGEHSLSILSRTARETLHCNICGSNSGKGFEANFEVLPSLLKSKFEGGVIDELLCLNFPREFRLPSGLMVLTYEKAVEESVYEQFRVVRAGQLQIVFRHDFKILSWNFCSRQHEVFVVRSSIAPEVNQLVQTAGKCTQIDTATVDSRMSPQDLLSDCNRFVMEGQRLTRSLEVLLVNDLGFSKSFVRCLQTAEVVNSMKDLMQFSLCNNIGAIESLQRYCQRGDPSTIHPTKKIDNAVQVPPTCSGKSISDSTRNKPKRNTPNQRSGGKCPRVSSPFPSPHLHSPGPRKVQGSPLRGFLISQLSRMDHETAKLEVNRNAATDPPTDAATDPPADAATDPPADDAKGLLHMPVASSSHYPPNHFNAMELDAILSMDKGLFEDTSILENDSPNEAGT